MSSGTYAVASIQGGGSLNLDGSLSLSTASSIGSLSVIGTLTGAGDVTVATTFTSAGRMTGSGRTIVGSDATGSITGGTLDRTLVNRGSITATGNSWWGTSQALLQNEGTFTENIPDTYSIAMAISGSGSTPKVRNSGLFRKTSDPSMSTVGWQFDNTGTVTSTYGGLSFDGGGIPGYAASGSWAGAQLSSGTFWWGPGTQISGAVKISGATVNAPDLQGDGSLDIGYGTLTLTDATTTSHVGSLTVGGTLTGTGDLTVATSFTSSGRMIGSGRTIVGSDATGSITGGTLDRTLVNRGSITATGNSWWGGAQALLQNEGTFTENISDTYSTALAISGSGSTPKIRNSGLFRRSSDPSMSTVGWQFDNAGTVTSTHGDLAFDGGGIPGSTGSGSWAGATLSGGTFTWGPATEIAGTVTISGATVNAADVQGDGTLRVFGGTLSLTDATTTSHVASLTVGATLTGRGDITVATSLTSSGRMSGSGRTIVASEATGSITGGTLDRTLVNRGSITATGNGWWGTSQALLENQGTFTQNIPDSFGNGMVVTEWGSPRVRNSGTFRKTGGSSTGVVDWQFDNAGTVEAASGRLSFTGGGIPGSAGSGSWAGAQLAQGTFWWGPGTRIAGDVSVTWGAVQARDLQGSGSLLVSGGTLSLNDAATMSHVASLAVSSPVTGAGSITATSTFSFVSGSMSGSGTTVIAPGATGTITGGTLARTLRNRGALTLASGSLTGAPGALLDNQARFVDNAEGSAPSLTPATGSPMAVLRNTGTVVKTAGSGDTFVDWAIDNRGVETAYSGRLVFRGPPVAPTGGTAAMARGEQYGAGSKAEPGVTHCDEVDPVNCATGGFYEDEVDLAVAGRGPALQAARSYDAMAAVLESGNGGSRLGPGWTHPYAERLELINDHVVLHGANAATSTFTRQPDGSFDAATRVKARLERAENDSYVLTYRDQTRSVFDGTGRLLRLVDRNGYATTLAYLPSGRIEAVTDEAGRALVYGYDTAGRITQISDPLGREVTYGYDAAGDLVSVTDPAGHVTRYGYDAEHRIVSMTDPRGHETRNRYDASDRVIEQTDPAGGVTRFSYTDTWTTVTDPRGHVTRYEQSDGLTTRVLRAVGAPLESVVSMVRDASGNVIRRSDAGGRVTTLAYNADGLPTRMTDPLGRVTTLTYNATGDPLTITDAVATTTMTYDAHGNPTSVKRPLTGSSSVATTTSDYDPAHPGDLISTTDPDGHVWHYAYDSDGNLVEQADPVGNRTTIDYNAIGWVTNTVGARGNAPGADPAQYETRLTYDDDGDVVAVQDPLGHTSRTTYDADGNPTTATDADGATTRMTYDELDRAIRVTRPDDSMLRFEYDEAGNRTAVTDALGHATSFAYDALDRVTSRVDALNRTTSYGYDAAGRQTSATDAAGRTTSYGYDAASQLTSVAYSDGQTHGVAYEYDDLGRRVRMIDASGTSSWSYDSLGRMVSATDGHDRRLSYAYDLAGRLTKISYPQALVAQTAPGQTITDPSVTRRYDDAGRVTSIEDWLGSSTAYAHDAAGDLVKQSYPNGTTATLTYDRAGALTRRTDGSPAGSILDLAYTRTATGRVHTASEAGSATSTLGYDERSQLQSSTVGGQTSAGFAYDLADRLTRITDSTTTTRLEYDAANQLQQTVDAATGDTRATFTYDPVGNRTQAQRTTSDPLTAPVPTTYGYDQAGHLTAVTKTATSPTQPAIDADYTYDGDGLRADLLWDRTAGLPEILADEHGLYITGPDGLPLQQLRFDGARRFYHHDQLGSTRALTDTTGAVVQRSDYDPYGQPTTPTDPTNPFGYAGQYTDHHTGLVYLRARWYDPATGQFLTLDPIGHASGETNLYRYAAGDPANHTDPSGLLFGGLTDAIASLDNPVSQAVAGALDGAFIGAPSRIFGFDPSCVGGTFDFGSTYLSLAVPFPGSKLKAAKTALEEIPDAFIVVRGGTKEMPKPGEVFSGAAGPTLEDAASGVPHGTLRSTTAGDIRASGGTVERAPEMSRGGNMNERHVNVCLGDGACPFGPEMPNPVPRASRIK